jgi:hypothetical protein
MMVQAGTSTTGIRGHPEEDGKSHSRACDSHTSDNFHGEEPRLAHINIHRQLMTPVVRAPASM